MRQYLRTTVASQYLVTLSVPRSLGQTQLGRGSMALKIPASLIHHIHTRQKCSPPGKSRKLIRVEDRSVRQIRLLLLRMAKNLLVSTLPSNNIAESS